MTKLPLDSISGPGKKGAQHPSFEWVNTLLGNLKIALSGTYHSFGFRRYAGRYLGAAAWRFNHRTDMAAMVRCQRPAYWSQSVIGI